jgi:hypothetical protein
VPTNFRSFLGFTVCSLGKGIESKIIQSCKFGFADLWAVYWFHIGTSCCAFVFYGQLPVAVDDQLFLFCWCTAESSKSAVALHQQDKCSRFLAFPELQRQ